MIADATLRLADPVIEQALATDGYAVVRPLGSAQAIALGREIAALYPAGVVPNQAQSNWYFGLIDPDRALAMAGARLVDAKLVPLLAPYFAGARCHYASVAIKPGGAAATPMHQHWPTTVDPFARRFGCWILLSEAEGDAGTFRLVPRSQQLLPFIRHPASGDYFDAFSETVDREHAVDVALQPGEAILFEDSILHGTRANPGHAMRIAAIANFVARDMDTAAVLPDGDGAFAVFDTDGRDGMAEYLRTGEWPGHWRRVATLPNRNRAISESEFIELLACGHKATLEFDPLDVVRNLPRDTTHSPPAPGGILAPLAKLASLLGVAGRTGAGAGR